MKMMNETMTAVFRLKTSEILVNTVAKPKRREHQSCPKDTRTEITDRHKPNYSLGRSNCTAGSL